MFEVKCNGMQLGIYTSLCTSVYANDKMEPTMITNWYQHSALIYLTDFLFWQMFNSYVFHSKTWPFRPWNTPKYLFYRYNYRFCLNFETSGFIRELFNRWHLSLIILNSEEEFWFKVEFDF